MEKPVFSDILLELHVPDFDIVRTFYKKLGFKVVWERKPEEYKGYMVMKRLNSVICFWGGNELIFKHPYFEKFANDTKRGYGVEIILFVDDVDAYYEKVKVFANVVEPLVMQPWGNKDFRIEDPNGYYIRISEPYDSLNPDKAVK